MVTGRGHYPKHPYFYYYQEVGYMQTHGDQYWKNGTFYTCDMVDCDTGEFKDKRDLIMYCDFVKTSKWWKNDEIWAMSGALKYNSSKPASLDTYGLGIEVTK